MVGYSSGDTNRQKLPDLASQKSPAGARDGYEYGTITTLSRTTHYKVFKTPFTGVPSVIVTAHSTAGTFVPRLIGTPNTGSFNVGALTAPAGGTARAYYVAFGPR